MSFNSTCWIGNRAHGNALAGTYGATIGSTSNDFGEGNEIEYLSPLECEFFARIDGRDQLFPNLECADFTADACAFEIVEPTPAPVEPTPAPVAPTAANVPTEAGQTSVAGQPSEEGGAESPTIAEATSSASVVRFVTGIVTAALSFVAMLA